MLSRYTLPQLLNLASPKPPGRSERACKSLGDYEAMIEKRAEERSREALEWYAA